MSYTYHNPKQSSIIPELPKPSPDGAYIDHLISLPNLASFYGTDVDGNRGGYGATFYDAFKSRIANPVTHCWHQRRPFFLKPYSSFSQVLADFFAVVPNIVLSLLAGLGIFGNFYLVVAAACIPAVIELVSGIIGLGQAFYYKCKSIIYKSDEEQERASQYFQDAITRLVLVVPLAVVSLTVAPIIGLIRLVTRSIATIVGHKETNEEELELAPSSASPR